MKKTRCLKVKATKRKLIAKEIFDVLMKNEIEKDSLISYLSFKFDATNRLIKEVIKNMKEANIIYEKDKKLFVKKNLIEEEEDREW